MPQLPTPPTLRRHLIQIAGVRDQREADLLMACGVAWLGFPLRLPVHKEDLSEAEAARIIRALRPPHEGVLITYLREANDILSLCQSLGVRRVQLHGEISLEELQAVKALAPHLFVIKSLIVRAHNQNELVTAVRQWSPYVEAFITDTYDPDTGASGATGKTHDWQISRRVVEVSPRPVILAGGLRPENVAQAIQEVQPAGVDAHTGVEGPDGRKEEALVRAFVDQARAAFTKMNER